MDLRDIPDMVDMVRLSVFSVEMGDRVGAAFAVSRGYVVTALHTVGEATNKVQLIDHRGNPSDGVIVARDEYLDLALMFSSGTPWPLKLERERPRFGELVLALGSPAGLDHSVSMGVVSHPNRNVRGSATITWSMTGMIQHDAFTSKGSSGGPLVNLRGDVVGMLHSGVPGTPGPGFAIPAEPIGEFVQQIADHGFVRHAYLGVRPQRNHDSAVGVRILEYDDGPLSAIGRITRLDDEIINSAEELVAGLLRRKPGDKVVVGGVWRNGLLANQMVTLGDHNDGQRGFV